MTPTWTVVRRPVCLPYRSRRSAGQGRDLRIPWSGNATRGIRPLSRVSKLTVLSTGWWRPFRERFQQHHSTNAMHFLRRASLHSHCYASCCLAANTRRRTLMHSRIRWPVTGDALRWVLKRWTGVRAARRYTQTFSPERLASFVRTRSRACPWGMQGGTRLLYSVRLYATHRYATDWYATHANATQRHSVRN